ncbi:MAG: protein phosphatase 2C domain-containing protein [Thiotrichaceae bacterium]|nr:protein phosphatase 2C domain-containing protein [Thiotrichaceae bacterium]
MKLNKHYFGQRIQGERSYQEDDFGFDSSHRDDFLMVLADGMGGYEGGALASERSIQAFMDAYYVSSGNITQRLKHSLGKANEQLALEKQSNIALKNMGCTFVAVAISSTSIEWISVGDSPLWLLRGGRLYRLNADHSMKPELQKQVDAGELTAEQMKVHPDRNMLRSAMMGSEIELIDQAHKTLEADDRILLASDGILSLTVDEMKQFLNESKNAKQAVNALLSAVENKAKSGQDNTTALVAYIPNKQSFTITGGGEHDWRLIVLLAILLLHLLFWIAVQIHWVKPVDILESLFPHSTEQLDNAKKLKSPNQQSDSTEESELSNQEPDNVGKTKLPSEQSDLDDNEELEVQDDVNEDESATDKKVDSDKNKKPDSEQAITSKNKDATVKEPLTPDSPF